MLVLWMARCLNEGLAGRLSGWWLDSSPKALLQMARCLNEGLAGRLSGWWLDGPPKAQLQVVDLDVVAEERDDVHSPLALDPSLDGKIAG